MKCEICNKEFKNKGISSHILKIHNISIKEYYDTYLKQEEEGICPDCGSIHNRDINAAKNIRNKGMNDITVGTTGLASLCCKH